MTKFTRALLHSTTLIVLFSLMGCGGSEGPGQGSGIVAAQKNLPDEGYWLCRLDYEEHYKDGHTRADFFAETGEGRAAVKQLITQECISGPYAVDCGDAVTNQRFACVRAENTGHLETYGSVTYCRLLFNTNMGWDPGQKSYESTGEDQRAAVKKIFKRCLYGVDPRACTDAILSDGLDCKPVQ